MIVSRMVVAHIGEVISDMVRFKSADVLIWGVWKIKSRAPDS